MHFRDDDLILNKVYHGVEVRQIVAPALDFIFDVLWENGNKIFSEMVGRHR